MLVRKRSYIYLVVAAICLATIGIFVKLAGPEVHFMTLIFFRFSLGFMLLLVLVPFMDKRAFRLDKQELGLYCLIGLLFTIAAAVYTAANMLAPVQNVYLISGVHPFFVLIFASFLLNETLTKRKLITLVVAMIGLAIINPFQLGGSALGNLLALLNAVLFAIMITLMRKADMKHGIGDVLWFFLFGTLFSFPFAHYFGFQGIAHSFPYVLGLGIVSTGLAYLFYNLAMEEIEVEIATIITTIITPITAILLAVLIVKEPLEVSTIIGGSIIILSAVYLEAQGLRATA